MSDISTTGYVIAAVAVTISSTIGLIAGLYQAF